MARATLSQEFARVSEPFSFSPTQVRKKHREALDHARSHSPLPSRYRVREEGRYRRLATRALRLRTDSEDRERTYHHDPLVAQVSEEGTDRLSRSYHTRPHASTGPRGDIPHGRGDRALLRYDTQRVDPVKKRLCDIRVRLLDGFAYI